MAAVFISDQLSVIGNPDKRGTIEPGLEVLPWERYDRTSFYSPEVLVVDLNLGNHIRESKHQHSAQKQIGDNKERFRVVFERLYEDSLSLLNQGGVIVVLLWDRVIVPSSRHRGIEQISSIDWLKRLGAMQNCTKLGKVPAVNKVGGDPVDWYLGISGDKYGISVPENRANTLAESREGTPLFSEVTEYVDDTGESVSDKGTLILLPQPRTWTQSPVGIARCIQEMAVERISDNAAIQRYNQPEVETPPTNEVLERIFRNIPKAESILSSTGKGVSSFQMEDEKDLQAVLNATLNLYFKDVRAEEPVESHGGSGGLIDFLLPKQGIGIEVKMNRDSLSMTQLAEQIGKAKEKYTRHSSVNRLYIFIYDREKEINPAEVEELGREDGIPVNIVVSS